MKNKGFALVSVLVISTVLLIMGMGAMYMTEMGFRSLSAEQRWHRLEKAANAGIMQVADKIQKSKECTINENLNFNFNGAAVEIQTIRAGSGCFIWSRATLGNSRVVKTAVLTIRPPTDALGAANFAFLNSLSIGGSASIASCDQECPTPALAIGNELQSPPEENLVSSCRNNLKGVTALVDPYVPNAFGQNENLTSRVFNGASNRDELLSLLTNGFGVNFLSDGTPYINVPSNCEFMAYNNCNTTTINNKTVISCSWGLETIAISWIGGTYNIINPNTGLTITQCEKIKLPNATINFNSPFTGGGIIQAKTINLGSSIGNVTFVAETVNLSQNGTNITDVNVFAKGISLTANNSTWSGGILYTGGGNATTCNTSNVASGCFSINIRSNTRIGTQDNPVLLISDNNMRIARNGNAQINGLVYLTENAREFIVGYGNGNFKLNGMIVSNIPKNNANVSNIPENNANVSINISGNFEIRFDRNVLNSLADRYNFVRRPVCREVSITMPFIQTKTTTY